MKFSTVFVAFGLIAAVAAQSKSSTAETPVETSSYTPEQQKCIKGCGSGLACIAECFGNPAPTEDMVNATTKCMGECPQGDGTESQTAKYAACQQKCIVDQFYSSGSGAQAAASSKGSSATKTGSSSGAASTGSSSSSDDDQSSPSGTSGSDDSSPTEENRSVKRKATATDEPPTMSLKQVKIELGKLFTEIISDDGSSADDVDKFIQMLKVVKKLKMEAADSISEKAVPPDFLLCPISGKTIQDPVVLVTGCTYDRESIEKYLREGNKITDGRPIDNCLVKLLISNPNWCEDSGYVLVDRNDVDSLLAKLSSSSLADKRSAAKVLRMLSERPKVFGALFGDSTDARGIIQQALTRGGADLDLQLDLVTLRDNIWPSEKAKKLVRQCGRRANDLAAVRRLSELDSNTRRLIKEVHGSLYGRENSDKAMEEARVDGIHTLALQILKDHMEFGDELLATLTLFLGNADAVDELKGQGAVDVLLPIAKGARDSGAVESAVCLLNGMCDEQEIEDHGLTQAVSKVLAPTA